MSKKLIREPKKRIVVSFSGGETSALMLEKILNEYSKTHEIKVVFANTGEENEETLEFVNNVSKELNVDIIWLEYDGHLKFKEVNFETAYRSHDLKEIANKWQNHPFRKFIEVYGLPNIKIPTCSRELKERTIDRYLRSIGWLPITRTKAIGIRADEMDRIQGGNWYPLVKWGIIKQMVNIHWDNKPFRLNLKGYQGNCKTCYKKSLRKLVTLYRENPFQFEFFKQMEIEFGKDYNLFRENNSVKDIRRMSKDKSIQNAVDDSINYNYQTSIFNGMELDISNGCSESCEAE